MNTANGVRPEGLNFYQSQDINGNHLLNEVLITGSNGSNALNVSAPTQVENFGTDKVLNVSFGVLNNTVSTPINTLSNYALAWDQYNAQAQSYTINLQAFNADGTTASSVTPVLTASNVSSGSSAPAWRFQAGSGAYMLAEAQHNNTTGLDFLNFQGYATNGTVNTAHFQIQSDLTHYASGATNHITQELIPSLSASPGGAASPLQFSQLSSANTNNYIIGWNETVQDLNGTHDQVEFVEFKQGSGGGVVARSTFQIADGQAQNIRIFSLPGDFILLAYGDDTATHLVEFNASGTQVASLTDPTSVTFSNVTSLGDGRVAVIYDDTNASYTSSQFDTKIFDFRTTGLNINDSGFTDGTNKYFAGTQFNDTIIGENNVNNTYYYVGQNATGSGPTDSFTGGTNGWNVAILPDALSNYTITTLNGVTTLTNATGDPAHRGTLNVTNVQELVFNPSADPSSNNGSCWRLLRAARSFSLGHCRTLASPCRSITVQC